MKKQLLASLLSLFLVAGLAPMAAASTSPCCSGTSDCAMDKSPCCPYKVLTKEECHRFCKAKAAAIAKDPSLAQPENKCKLCRAIVKADPSMKPICMKLRKNCRKMKKHCMNSSCDQSSSEQNASNSSQPITNSSSQQNANASSSSSSSSSSMNSDVAAQSSNSNQQSSSSSTSAN